MIKILVAMSFRKRVQEYTDAQTRRTYQGEWAVSIYEPYQMETLSIVSLICIITLLYTVKSL